MEQSYCIRCRQIAHPQQFNGACPKCGAHTGLVPWRQLAPDIKTKLEAGQPAVDKPGR